MVFKHLRYYSTWNVINASALLAEDNTLETKVNVFSFSTGKQNLITATIIPQERNGYNGQNMDENEEAI